MGSEPVANDLARYERPREQPDDFRQRMLANIAALAFTVALTAVGIWLAISIADLRKSQDCVLMGRRDCARISVTPQNRREGPETDSSRYMAPTGKANVH